MIQNLTGTYRYFGTYYNSRMVNFKLVSTRHYTRLSNNNAQQLFPSVTKNVLKQALGYFTFLFFYVESVKQVAAAFLHKINL